MADSNEREAADDGELKGATGGDGKTLPESTFSSVSSIFNFLLASSDVIAPPSRTFGPDHFCGHSNDKYVQKSTMDIKICLILL